MKTLILENGKRVEISEESYEKLSRAVKEENVDNKSSLVENYKMVYELGNVKPIKTTIKKDLQVYVNKVFSDKSVFGNNCVFIKCKFGSGCEFGSDCEFGYRCEFYSGCEFGSDCEFDSGCKKQKPYWDENGKHE